MKKAIVMILLAMQIISTMPAAASVKFALDAKSMAQGGLVVKIRLPERFRVLTNQQFDLRVEATTITNTNATLKIILDGSDFTPSLPTPEVSTDNASPMLSA